MNAPLITWWEDTNTTQLNSWNIGVVDAGATSAVKEFLIWNNKGGDGVAPISDAVNCFITTKDTNGSDGIGTAAQELIDGKWVNVCCTTAGKNPLLPAEWTAVGGKEGKEVRGGGAASTTPGLIVGTANDGTTTNSTANFARVQARVTIPSSALNGRVDFLTRLGFQYT